MRFERGNQVEILLKKKVPSGAWRSGEIVADSKDGYTVRYYRGSKVVVESVPVEAVRPCSPPVVAPVTWAVGDIVEVLDDGYWKAAKVEEVMEQNYYHVHLIGSIDEFRVEKSKIRARQEWKDNKWALMDSGSSKSTMSTMLNKTKPKRQDDLTNIKQVQESALQSKTLKRSSPSSSCSDEAFEENIQKRRAVEEIHDSYSFIGKVDSCAYPKENQGKANKQTFTKKTITFNNAISKNHDVAQFLASTLDTDDCVSTMSSVGSCSIINAGPDRLLSHSSSGCSQNTDPLCSDADSFEHSGLEEEMSANQSIEEYAQRTHELQLYTYRCTLEALYASGPLSWEQEALLTNLRIRLCVSIDEHLMELRRLKSIRDCYLRCQ